MTSKPPAEIRFKHNISALSSMLYDICDDSHSRGYPINLKLVELACAYVNNAKPVKILEDYIYHSVRLWGEIKVENENFFANNNNIAAIFGGLPIGGDQLKIFSGLYTGRDNRGERYISKEDTSELFRYLHALTRISINYMFDNPECYRILKLKLHSAKKYTLDLAVLASEWNIDRTLE